MLGKILGEEARIESVLLDQRHVGGMSSGPRPGEDGLQRMVA